MHTRASLWTTVALCAAVAPATAAAQTFAGVTPPRPEIAARIAFGASALVAGDLVFVGRPGESALFPMPGSEPGSVHVFRREGDAWTQIARVGTDDVDVGDGFGQSLAVDGDLLVVGAPSEDEGRGAVYVFRRQGDAWAQVERFQPDALAAGNGFGTAVAAANGEIVAGAPGRASVFAFRGGIGARSTAEVRPEAAAAESRFGAALGLDGTLLLVGAPGPFDLALVEGEPRFGQGAAYVFARDGERWAQRAALAAPGSASFGASVLLAGGQALVGAPISDHAAGAVFRFTPDGTGDWTAAGRFGAAEAAPQALYGYALSLAGGQLLVGAPGYQGFQGGVYVLDPTGEGDWVESQVLTQETQGLLGFFGSTVAGGDALMVVGAPTAEFFEGLGFVYARVGDAWVEEDDIVEAEFGREPITGGERRCSEDGDAAGFSCENVELESFLPVSAVGGRRGIMVSDLWGWTDPDTGREYALLGRFDGTSFIDVTDAENPRYLGNLPLTTGAHANLWRDIKVYANHAYIVADNAGEHGVQIFDLTHLRDVTSPQEFAEDAHYDGIHSAHNIVIDEQTGFAYTVGNSGGGETCGGALHMIDIREPENPKFAGCYADPSTGTAHTGYTHDAQCVVYHGPDEDYTGHEVCFNASETALGIGDVTDKDAPKPIATASYPNVGYTHQGWLSEDQRYFFLDDELDELQGGVTGTRTLVWDVQDLDDPVLATQYVSDNPASDHNLYVRGHFVYESNYVSGLRILDISDPENPKQVGYFDTVPWSPDAPGFAGSWSNYPFFESGNIIVSSMREGLFILKKRQTELVP